MKRAYSLLTIKSVDKEKRVFSGIASTPTPDRDGDIMDPKGAKFELPMPFLWQHDSSDPIGWITRTEVTEKGIKVWGKVADIAEAGQLQERLKTAWQMIKSRLVRGLSIGFRDVESDRIANTYGRHYKLWDWLELSAVTVPANQQATILTVKSIDSQIIAASGKSRVHKTSSVLGKSFNKERNVKTLREKLAALHDARKVKTARQDEMMELVKTEERHFSEEEAAEFDQLTMEIKDLDHDIRLKSYEVRQAESAVQVKAGSFAEASRSRGPEVIIAGNNDKDEKFKGQNYTRMIIAKAAARLEDVSPVAVAQQRWGKEYPTLVKLIKAAVEGGGSGSGEWGAELVNANTQYTGDFIEMLMQKTAFDQLGLREVPANVMIKGQDGAATGYWVGESAAIPVSAQSFSNVSLTPLKVAALAVISNELIRDSSPAAEMLVRDMLIAASAQRVDLTFFGTGAASAGVSPAGILNGVTGTASAGTDGDGVREDLKALYAIFIAALNASGLKIAMNPALAKSLQLMTNALGNKEFPDIRQTGGELEGDPVVTGDNINSAHMILLKPSDIWKIGDTGVQVSLSREAMIEMDSAPANESQGPTTASGAVVSMFQTESTAIKVVRSINYQKRRSGCVQYINDAAYGTSGS